MASLPSLTDEFIADSYRGILHTSNQPVTGSELKQVYDGLGNSTGLKISSTTIGIGNFNFPTTGTLGQTLVFDSGGNLNASTLFPVGSVYFTTTDTNPGTFLGGTWNRIGQGRFIASVGTGNDGTLSQEISAGNSGGVYKHTLTESEMPAHSHDARIRWVSVDDDNAGTSGNLGTSFRSLQDVNRLVSTMPQPTLEVVSSGGGISHENTPPSFGLYVWSRIS